MPWHGRGVMHDCGIGAERKWRDVAVVPYVRDETRRRKDFTEPAQLRCVSSRRGDTMAAFHLSPTLGARFWLACRKNVGLACTDIHKRSGC